MMDERTSAPSIETDFALWLQTPLGRVVLAHEADLIRERLPSLHGDALLWCAASAPADLTSCRVGLRVLAHAAPELGVVPEGFQGAVCSTLDALPFRTASFHALVIQHGFDGTQDVHGAVREAVRVLEWGGRMLIVGFNPLSSWGVRRALTPRRFRLGPWGLRFVSAARLSDWLSLLGLRVLETVHVLYRPPLAQAALLRERRPQSRRSGRTGVLPASLLPESLRLPLGAVYLIHARREGAAGTVLRPTWRRPRGMLVPVGATRLGAAARQTEGAGS